MDRWAQSRCRPGSGLRATIQEPDDLGQLVKLSGFGFLLWKWGQLYIHAVRSFVKSKRRGSVESTQPRTWRLLLYEGERVLKGRSWRVSSALRAPVH